MALLRASKGDALVLLATFLLTVFEDLTLGIAVGVTLGAFLLLHRLADAVEVRTGEELVVEDQADDYQGRRTRYDSRSATDPDLMIYRISGAFFFGATASVNTVFDRVGAHPRQFVFDFSEVPLVDISAAKALESFVHKLTRSGTTVFVAGARPSVRRVLLASGLREHQVHYVDTVAEARSMPNPEQECGARALALSGA